MKLTKNFTVEEFIKSSVAKNKKIDNTPDDEALFYIEQLAQQLQLIRDAYGKPIVISSGYRCPKLNKAVGGAKTSQHLTGAAADIHSLSDTLEDNLELWDCIMYLYNEGKLLFRQLIWEYGDQNIGPDWIHYAIFDGKHDRKGYQILHILK